MKICANCGAQIPDDAVFCNNCGSSLSDSSAPQQGNPDMSAGNGNFQQPNYGQPQQQYQQQQYQQPYPAYDPKDHTQEFDAKDIADNKLFAAYAYLIPILAAFLIGIYIKDSAFVKFHIKNALRLDIAGLLIIIPSIIPVLGWIVTGVCLIILLVVEIMAIVWAFQGKAKELPFISGIGFLK